MRRLAVPVGLTVVISAVLIVLVLPNVSLIPVEAASVEARTVDSMLGFEFAVMAAIFTLCMVFFFYSIVIFRRKPGQTGDGEPIHGNTSLEIGWTVVPLVFVIGLAFWGADKLEQVTNQNNLDLTVEVTGSQWSWSFSYPEVGPGGESITSPDLMLPVDRRVLFVMRSEDVIHSFWVPEFRLKQDAVPGRETNLVITPSEIGEYEVRCAELCGRRHAFMLATVNVMSQDDFDAWVVEQTTLPEDPVARGAIFAQRYGCAACHSIDGSRLVGPSWQGLFGEQVTFTDGTTATADEAYIRESILDPGAHVVEGFEDGIMPPNFGDRLAADPQESLDEIIADLIAYILSLSQ